MKNIEDINKAAIQKITANKKITDFSPGDTIKVGVKIVEGKRERIKKLKSSRNDEIIKLLNSINPLIQKYMDDNSIDILIDKKNIYIANKKYEITKNLILLIDENYK
jgi:hypothetical protein